MKYALLAAAILYFVITRDRFIYRYIEPFWMFGFHGSTLMWSLLAALLVAAGGRRALWLLPPLWPLIPVVIMGWLNQRVLRYDALAEHASAEEMQQLFAARRGTLFVMGAILALLAYVPFVGFVAPVLFGLAFIHLLLGELQALRDAPIEGTSVRL